ncbi:MAG TPA: TIGR01777 family oxidoreductase [Prolixibacteraceae bacterium]|nr:TIGR01777 family oxidoreductase [Prolixibacteraceae bacterium]
MSHNIAISGASGYISQSIQKNDLFKKYSFVKLSRNEPEHIWKEKIANANIIINLAGAPVIKRWTAKNKTEILESRINTTQKIVSIINQLPPQNSPQLLISASAIGIYPYKGTEMLDEYSSKRGDSFLSQVVEKWENEANKLHHINTRLVIMRIGIVLGKNGGLLKKTLPLFKIGLGGKIASGNQAFSFIHINDLVKAVHYFIENKSTKGIYNIVSPQITNNTHFTKALGKAMKRTAVTPVPAFALRLLFGKVSQIMINGERVYPTRLIESGFNFDFPNIENAVKAIVAKT